MMFVIVPLENRFTPTRNLPVGDPMLAHQEGIVTPK